MGSVRERTGEIGIFRAIGFRKSHVMRIIFLEAGIVSGLAGVLGYLIGIGGTHIGLKLFSGSPSLGAPINIEMVIGAVFLAIVVGLVASAYPAFMAARLNPNEALRSL
jgi:putative ABC transport system permease protein